MISLLWRLLGGQEEAASCSSELLIEYASLYGPRILVVVALGALTIFRREMSCNHCYVEQPPASRAEPTEVSSHTVAWDEEEAEELLDGAALYASGAALLPYAVRAAQVLEWISRFLGLPASFVASFLDRIEQHAMTAEQILDQAGCFCSPYPLASILGAHPPRTITVVSTDEPLFSSALPADVHMHILSFLHPKDLVTVACVNRMSRQLVDDDDIQHANGYISIGLWKNIFYRDYAWLVEAWDVGRAAMRRMGQEPSYTKDFYFQFSLTYLNYILAGQNSDKQDGRCLVGIGGHIYDLSSFLDSHPGTPETVMAHAGHDATSFFVGMNHSLGARKRAQRLCVAVDMSYVDKDLCGAKPTSACEVLRRDEPELVPSVVEAPITFHLHTEVRSKGTLKRIRDALREEEVKFQRVVAKLDEPALLGEINPYYDPVACKWKAWFTNQQLEVVFLDDLSDDM